MVIFYSKTSTVMQKAHLVLIKEIQCTCLLQVASLLAKKNVNACPKAFTKSMLLAR
jgi:hypothetical protein